MKVNKALNTYRSQAEKYLPEKVKVLFIAESPPAPDKNGRRSYIHFDTARSKGYCNQRDEKNP